MATGPQEERADTNRHANDEERTNARDPQLTGTSRPAKLEHSITPNATDRGCLLSHGGALSSAEAPTYTAAPTTQVARERARATGERKLHRPTYL